MNELPRRFCSRYSGGGALALLAPASAFRRKLANALPKHRFGDATHLERVHAFVQASYSLTEFRDRYMMLPVIQGSASCRARLEVPPKNQVPARSSP